MNKDQIRRRRGARTRKIIAESRVIRLSVHRSNQHIYAQLIDADASKTLATVSTLGPIEGNAVGYGGNVMAAASVGKRIAEKAKQLGIEKVAFDRSGYKYHGRVKALADAAREAGLNF